MVPSPLADVRTRRSQGQVSIARGFNPSSSSALPSCLGLRGVANWLRPIIGHFLTMINVAEDNGATVISKEAQVRSLGAVVRQGLPPISSAEMVPVRRSIRGPAWWSRPFLRVSLPLGSRGDIRMTAQMPIKA